MKKMSNWKRALSLGLALLMTVSMTACGDKGKNGNDPKSGGKDGKESSQLSKECVYRVSNIDLPGENEDINVIGAFKSGDQYELLTSFYDYSTDYNGLQVLNLHTIKLDGTVVSSKTMERPVVEGEADSSSTVPAGEPEQDGNTEGNAEETEDMLGDPEELPYDGDGDYYNDDDYSYEYTNYNNAIITENNIFAQRYHSKDAYVDGEYVNENSMSIVCWDKEGKVLWNTPVDMTQYQNEEEYSYISAFIPMGENALGLILSGSKNGIIQVSADGTVSGLKKSGSDRDAFSRDPYVALREDGTLIISYYNDDYSKQYISTYDPKNDSYGTEYEVPQAAKYSGFYNFSAGLKYDVMYANSEGVFGFNLGETETHKIMDYVNSDLATYGLNNMVSIDENTFIATYYDPSNYSNVFGLFTYVKPEDIQDKITLLYAGVGIDMDMKTGVIRFNKSNDKYRIAVKDYTEYNTDEDYTQGYTRLNNDIIAGNIPDILLLDDSMPVESYAAKGILANIDEFIRNDEELKNMEFMDNVFEAYRIDGVLYRVVPKFYVNTWIGKKSMVGDRTSWTMEEVKQAASKLTGDKKIFGTEYETMTRDYFITKVLSYCGNDFVNINTGACNFENKNFIDLLEYAKTLPEEEQSNNDDDYWEEYWENYYSQYRENRSLLMELQIYDLSNVKYQIKGMMGEDVSFVGFPTESGAGSYIKATNTYAIFEKSANKEGAWEFLRTFLTEDYQRNEDYKYGYESGMPVMKKLVKEQADKLTQRPYWEDEDGTKTYYDDTFWMNGDSIILEPFTQAEADRIFDFVCSVNKAGYSDENVSNIVAEEAGSFFAGSKSAKDVANMIQNRVQLYVNENR